MLNKKRFQKILEEAQLKVAQNCYLSSEKLDIYWKEFKDIPLAEDLFDQCVSAVSKRSNFFPKVAEIWEEIEKHRRANRVPRIEGETFRHLTPKPAWFDAIVAQEKAAQRERQDRFNGGNYLGGAAY